MQLVLEQRPAQGLADFPCAFAGVLPIRKTDEAHDFVNGLPRGSRAK
jgi:hypothetical protein